MSSSKAADSIDLTAQLVDAVKQARVERSSIYLQGGGSKQRLYGRQCDGAPLDLREHRGIISYSPTEMVISARAGTGIAELEEATAEHGQCLPFDPGNFSRRATIGGTLATNSAGPARPWRGNVRDAVLGTRLINGRGEALYFGGQVMKNVAGYDLSRLQAGALGTLGLITEVSLRLLPLPAARVSISAAMSASRALECMREVARRPVPLAGACWTQGELHLAFEGSERAVQALQGELADFQRSDAAPWQALRNWAPSALNGDGPFWCIHMAAATPLDEANAPLIIDWAGARRFYAGSIDERRISEIAAAGRGHEQYMGGGLSPAHPGPQLPEPARALQTRLKQALDPDRIFNIGRLYDWL